MLYEYQKNVANKAHGLGNHILLLECGTGKTICELAIINYRLKQGHIRNCLVVAPLSVLWSAWEGDIQKFFPDLTYEILWHYDAEKRRAMIAGFNKQIAIINYDAIDIYADLLDRFDMIVLDESTMIKNPASDVSRALLRLAIRSKYKSALTATPGFRPEHYWAQLQFVGAINCKFAKFQSKFCIPIPLGGTGLTQWVTATERLPILKDLIAGCSIKLTKEECLSLPLKTFSVRDVFLPDDAMRLYKCMVRDHLVRLPSDTIIAEFPPVLRQKLRQMADGVLYNHETGVRHRIHSAKLNELDHIVNMTDGQIIIWANYVKDIEEISEKYKALTYCGATKDKEKNSKDFMAGKNRIIVCHPLSAGHGLTWVNCNIQVYYNLPDSLELYLQSQDRTHRIGQVNPCTYYILRARHTVDDIVWSRLKRNEEFQDELTNFSNTCFSGKVI